MIIVIAFTKYKVLYSLPLNSKSSLSISDIQDNLPEVTSTQNRMVTESDYNYFPLSYSNTIKSTEERLIKELELKTDIESKKKLIKIKNDLRKNQLGLVTNVSLPEIK